MAPERHGLFHGAFHLYQARDRSCKTQVFKAVDKKITAKIQLCDEQKAQRKIVGWILPPDLLQTNERRQ